MGRKGKEQEEGGGGGWGGGVGKEKQGGRGELGWEGRRIGIVEKEQRHEEDRVRDEKTPR